MRHKQRSFEFFCLSMICANYEYIPYLLLMNKLFFAYSYGQLGVNDDKGDARNL